MTKINKIFDKYFDLCETDLFQLYTLFSFSFAQFYRWGTASPASPDRTSLVIIEEITTPVFAHCF